ncbi:hypothetical protein SB724_19765, partial [Bacillus sp. SIMBA_031]
MEMFLRVTFPVFFAVTLYLIGSPTTDGECIPETSATVENDMAGAPTKGVSVELEAAGNPGPTTGVALA